VTEPQGRPENLDQKPVPAIINANLLFGFLFLPGPFKSPLTFSGQTIT